jgi:hypothetical protein
MALYQCLNARLPGWQRISADEPSFLARLADGSDLIALICWTNLGKTYPVHGEREGESDYAP